MEMEVERLPKELLVAILAHLPFSDLQRCLLVSRRWLDAGLERSLWRDFHLGSKPKSGLFLYNNISNFSTHLL